MTLVLLLLLVLALPRPLWLNAALTTLLIVSLLGAPNGNLLVGAVRLIDIAVAAALVLCGISALSWWARRHPMPEQGTTLRADGVGDD